MGSRLSRNGHVPSLISSCFASSRYASPPRIVLRLLFQLPSIASASHLPPSFARGICPSQDDGQCDVCASSSRLRGFTWTPFKHATHDGVNSSQNPSKKCIVAQSSLRYCSGIALANAKRYAANQLSDPKRVLASALRHIQEAARTCLLRPVIL